MNEKRGDPVKEKKNRSATGRVGKTPIGSRRPVREAGGGGKGAPWGEGSVRWARRGHLSRRNWGGKCREVAAKIPNFLGEALTIMLVHSGIALLLWIGYQKWPIIATGGVFSANDQRKTSGGNVDVGDGL